MQLKQPASSEELLFCCNSRRHRDASHPLRAAPPRIPASLLVGNESVASPEIGRRLTPAITEADLIPGLDPRIPRDKLDHGPRQSPASLRRARDAHVVTRSGALAVVDAVADADLCVGLCERRRESLAGARKRLGS